MNFSFNSWVLYRILIFIYLSKLLGCCVYVKPKDFDVTSSEESDDECEHCTGHVEKKRKNKQLPDTGDASPDNDGW